MIILRRPYRQKLLINKELSGNQDGINKIFTLPYSYKSGAIFITYNGQSLYPGNDFEEISDTAIKFKYIAPWAEDVLRAHFERP